MHLIRQKWDIDFYVAFVRYIMMKNIKKLFLKDASKNCLWINHNFDFDYLLQVRWENWTE